MVFLDPEKIITDFLRTHIIDPRNRAETTNSDTFTATSGQTTFSLSSSTGTKVSCVTSVTVDGTAQNKWRDYYPSFEDEKIVFFSGQTTGAVIIINYKEGSTNWIFADKPNKKIKEASFPRIRVGIVGGSGTRLGQYKANVETGIHFQVDVWGKEKQVGQIFTIDSKKYTGEKLVNYLSFQITNAFEDHEEDLFPALYSYVLLQVPNSMPFDEEFQSHRKKVEFMLNGLNIGRVS